MREIKFRAWDTKRKEMYYDVVCSFFSDGGLEIKQLNLKKKIDRVIIKKEVMQFTGLKDKNGKEIFEGDILQSYPTKDVRFIVGYGENGDNQTFGFNLKSIGRDSVYSFEMSIKKMEIIGNIYENPELIKSKQGNNK